MNDTMTDRDLLEAAAKAAGIDFIISGGQLWTTMDGSIHKYTERWNPLANNDQALRLAVALRISIMLAETDPCTPDCAYAETLPGGPVWRYIYTKDDDPLAATRRAIVRAAAAIGEKMT